MLVYGQEHKKAQYLLLEVGISNLSDAANSVVEYGLVLGPPYNTSTRPIHHSETPVGETVLEPAPGLIVPVAPAGCQTALRIAPCSLPQISTQNLSP